eukprot:PhM_4_TR9130/c0_g2_i2/m.7560
MGVLKNFDCATMSHTTVTNGAEDFKTILPGLSYLGMCTSEGCRARGQRVVCNRGMGDHLVNDDIVSGVILCPACRGPVEMQTIALFRTDGRFVLHDHSTSEETLRVHGDEVVMLGQQAAGGGSSSLLLTIHARELNARGSKKDCLIC